MVRTIGIGPAWVLLLVLLVGVMACLLACLGQGGSMTPMPPHVACVAATQVRGAEDLNTILVMEAIGRSLYLQGRLQEALDQYQAALAVRTQVLGGQHPGTQAAAGELKTMRMVVNMQKGSSAIDDFMSKY